MIDTFGDSVTSVVLTKTEIVAGCVDGTVRTFDIRNGRCAGFLWFICTLFNCFEGMLVTGFLNLLPLLLFIWTVCSTMEESYEFRLTSLLALTIMSRTYLGIKYLRISILAQK